MIGLSSGCRLRFERAPNIPSRHGAPRLPGLGNLTRLAIAALAGWLALRWSGDLAHVFLAQSVALVAFGLINVAAVAGGAWFGPLVWPWSAAALQRRSAT